MKEHPHDRGGRKVTELRFSAAEMDTLWAQVMSEFGEKNNEDFEKAFRRAVRMRAMRKLSMFSGGGFEVPLATGPKYAQEPWVGTETDDGGLLLRLGKV